MTKKDKWLLWLVFAFIIVPALKWVIKHDKQPIQRSIVWVEYKIDSAVAWVEDKTESGIIYVFGESGEDILTREFGKAFSKKFILSLKMLNNKRVLNGEVTLVDENLTVRPFRNKYTVAYKGNQGTMLESLRRGCYWDYDLLISLDMTQSGDESYVVSNIREISQPEFDEYRIITTGIVSSSPNYWDLDKDLIIKKEVTALSVVKKPDLTVVVSIEGNGKEFAIDEHVVSHIEDKINQINHVGEGGSVDLETLVVDLDSEVGYTKEVYSKTLLKGVGLESKLYLVDYQSMTMKDNEWVPETIGQSIVTGSGFPIYIRLGVDEDLFEMRLIGSENQPVEECLN